MAQTTTNHPQVSFRADWPEPADLTQALTLRLPDFNLVQWVERTGSTNMDLMQRLRQKDHPDHTNLPCLLGAHLQTAGRGRAGRPWHNAQGAALMFSCAFRINVPMAQLAGLSPALGVAACEALRKLIAHTQTEQGPGQLACGRPSPVSTPQINPHRLALKWPNDLQWDAGKLAGILVQTHQPAGSRTPWLVAGIGLNMQQAVHLSESLGRPVSDWSQICDIPAAQIVAAIACSWTEALKDYAASGYAGFVERFAQVDVLAGALVDVTDQGTILQTGTARGTDSIGRLLVETANGIAPIMVGDVSIRPVLQPETP